MLRASVDGRHVSVSRHRLTLVVGVVGARRQHNGGARHLLIGDLTEKVVDAVSTVATIEAFDVAVTEIFPAASIVVPVTVATVRAGC